MGKLQVCEQHSDEGKAADGHFQSELSSNYMSEVLKTMQYTIDRTLDAKGLSCPMPSVKTALALEQMKVGQVIEVITDDPVSKRDLPVWAQSTGNELLEIKEEDKVIKIYLRKA